MGKSLGIILVIVGVILNNVVYLQDLWLGQGAITLDGPRAYGGLVVSVVIVLVGLVMLVRRAK